MSYEYFAFWRNSRRVTSLVVGALFLITIAPAYAAKFKQRDRKPASEHTRSAGSRGCPGSNGIPLTVLAPQTYVGKTISQRPMFVWYASAAHKARFRLFEFKSDIDVKQIGKIEEIPTKVGINKLKLPNDYPKLAVGKKYLWQIAIDCRVGTVVKRAEFTVINPPQSLAKKKQGQEETQRRKDAETRRHRCGGGLNRPPIGSHQIADFDGGLRPLGLTAPDTELGTQRAPRPRVPASPCHPVNIQGEINNYAVNELWYEALEQALQTTDNGKLSPTGSVLVQELAQSELVEGKKSDIELIKQRIKYLQRISRDF